MAFASRCPYCTEGVPAPPSHIWWRCARFASHRAHLSPATLFLLKTAVPCLQEAGLLPLGASALRPLLPGIWQTMIDIQQAIIDLPIPEWVVEEEDTMPLIRLAQLHREAHEAAFWAQQKQRKHKYRRIQVEHIQEQERHEAGPDTRAGAQRWAPFQAPGPGAMVPYQGPPPPAPLPQQGAPIATIPACSCGRPNRTVYCTGGCNNWGCHACVRSFPTSRQPRCATCAFSFVQEGRG